MESQPIRFFLDSFYCCTIYLFQIIGNSIENYMYGMDREKRQFLPRIFVYAPALGTHILLELAATFFHGKNQNNIYETSDRKKMLISVRCGIYMWKRKRPNINSNNRQTEMRQKNLQQESRRSEYGMEKEMTVEYGYFEDAFLIHW